MAKAFPYLAQATDWSPHPRRRSTKMPSLPRTGRRSRRSRHRNRSTRCSAFQGTSRSVGRCDRRDLRVKATLCYGRAHRAMAEGKAVEGKAVVKVGAARAVVRAEAARAARTGAERFVSAGDAKIREDPDAASSANMGSNLWAVGQGRARESRAYWIRRC